MLYIRDHFNIFCMQIKRPQLHETAERGDVEAVKRLLATSSVKINSTTKVRRFSLYVK